MFRRQAKLGATRRVAVPPVGFEPTTSGLKVRWADALFFLFNGGS